MPIQFACPSCARGYSVKEELAGKSAKCGQCGHKMKIPLAATKAAVPSSATSSLAAKSSATKSTAAKVAASPARVPTAKAPASDPATSSWLDEELESARVEAKTKSAAPPMTSDSVCPSCNAPLGAGALICVKCGYDKRIRGRRSVEHVDEDAAAPQRSKLGHMGSLLRGTFFSFLAAMLGAIIWAVLAYLTESEFGIVAWGLGGLAGLGMALGHEDDDGTFAGILAAFMSMLGIVAAKVFIVIILIAAFVSSAVNEIEIDASGEAFGDPVEMRRSVLAATMAMKELEAAGQDADNLDEAQFEAALEKSRAEVADLSPEQVNERYNQFAEEQGLEGELEDFDEEEEFADDEFADDDAEDDEGEGEAVALNEPDEEVTFSSVVGSLFGPMDGLFILLAFFTAYKVGAGQADD